jgi:hypothetical protein
MKVIMYHSILEDDTVEVVELLQNPSKEEIKTEKIYDIDEAMMFQKKLIQFGYDQVGGYFYE